MGENTGLCPKLLQGSLVLVGHVRPALWVQVGHQGFHGAREGVQRMLDAVTLATNCGLPSIEVIGVHGGKP